jgi:hypothetical protein
MTESASGGLVSTCLSLWPWASLPWRVSRSGVIMLIYLDLDHAMKKLQAERAAEVCPKANY